MNTSKVEEYYLVVSNGRILKRFMNFEKQNQRKEGVPDSNLHDEEE